MSEQANKSVAMRRIAIRATPEQVFKAVSEPEHLTKWFCDGIDTEGGRFRFWGKSLLHATERDQARQSLARLEPPRLLAIDWPYGGLATRLTFEISERPDGSEVVLRHDLTGNEDDLKWWLAIDGVAVILYNLRSYLESGAARLVFDLRDKGSVVRCDVTVEAPADDVWAALTLPEQMDKWVGTGAQVELREGGEYRYGWGEGPRKILALEPGKRLVTDWFFEGEPQTTAEWTVEGSGGKTRVTITHSGFDDASHAENYNQGWNAFLGALAALVEGRSPVSKVE